MATPSKVWLPAFLRFCQMVRITSKDAEGPVPIIPYEGQKRFLREVAEGLENGVHHFTVLKSRQLGISTILLALDIFWLYMHEGLQGALVFDTADNKDAARQTLTEMLDSLPPRFRVPVLKHNRNALVLANGSRLQYMSAGKNKNSGLGRSRALNFVHASECSSWGDQKGLDSLWHALSEVNPNRLYIFESTALGYNLFHDMWNEAKAFPGQKDIFIGWWSKDNQRIERDNPEFALWWGQHPQLTEYEAKTAEAVERDYGWQISPEQWAWYRKRAYEKDEHSLLEEQPSHEEEAFQATGRSFFQLKRIGLDMDVIAKHGVAHKGYRYHLGNSFLTMRVEETTIPDEVDLKVWESPVKDGKYAFGVDPAFGRSEEKDRSTISVWRCYSDKLVQVAEYNTPFPETRHVAWVMAHLAGCYRDCVINLEVTGPGGETLMELNHLRQQIAFAHLRDHGDQINPQWALDQARWYLYHRPDSMGPGFAYGFKTGFESKQRLLYRMRDSYETEMMVGRSMYLLEEMRTFVQDGGALHGSGRNKDDRVLAASLANLAWVEWVRPAMIANNQTYARETAKEIERRRREDATINDWLVPLFLENQRKARADAELRRMLEF